METLSVPDAVSEKLGNAGSEGLLTMFGEAHRLSMDSFALQLAGLEGRLGQRFEAIDRRFEATDRRFEQIDRRFQQIERRFEQIDARFDRLEQKWDQKFELFEARMERRLEQTKVEILRWVFLFWATQFAAFVGILSFVLRR
jgi:hypothetical protein